MSAILELSNLGKHFGGHHVFDDINISVNKGEVYGIIGTNGSGKTSIHLVLPAQNPHPERWEAV